MKDYPRGPLRQFERVPSPSAWPEDPVEVRVRALLDLDFATTLARLGCPDPNGELLRIVERADKYLGWATRQLSG